jgi:hypothetical protein
MPGLLRGVARTAVVAGTATAVSNRVSRRQARRWSGDQDQYYEQQPAQQAPAQAYTPEEPSADEQIAQVEKLAGLKDQGILTDAEFSAKKAQILGL